MTAEPAIVVLARAGLPTARRIAEVIGGEVQAPARIAEASTPITAVAPQLRALFAAGRPIVGVCAAGILVRALAPALGDKHDEPPVLA
ncbi:MAG: precorrin-3B C(17)-methyltransferase, partial [Alphaproteobacteria bacterium]